MPKSKHSKFNFLDYTFRPLGGISTHSLTHLYKSFNTTSAVQGLFAVEVINDLAGSLLGTRHVHIRLYFGEKKVEPYRAFKYEKIPDYIPSRHHTNHTKSQAQRKFGYLMKGFRYTWLKPPSTTYSNTCWELYQDSERKLEADIPKLINVTKKNFLPIILQHMKDTWPTAVHRNPRQCIVHMVQSNKYNFQFLKYQHILHLMARGSQATPEAILETFALHVEEDGRNYQVMNYEVPDMKATDPETIPIHFIPEKIGVTEGMTDD